MTFTHFIWAYYLTGTLFVARIMGTHTQQDTELQLHGRTWTFRKFVNQLPKNVLSVILTLVAIAVWLPTFLFMLFGKKD